MPSISGTLGDTGVHMQAQTEPIFIQDPTQPFDLETSSTHKHTKLYTHLLVSIKSELSQSETERGPERPCRINTQGS